MNRQNAIRPIAIIPIFGIVGSFLAIISLLRNFDSLDFIFPNDSICPSISAPTYIPNKNARVIYTQYKDGHRE